MGGRTLDVAWQSFDTGGYTGQWGAAGKLAVLHEKEIVLNQDDTVNLLASIELLRGIVDTLDVQTVEYDLAPIHPAVAFEQPQKRDPSAVDHVVDHGVQGDLTAGHLQTHIEALPDG